MVASVGVLAAAVAAGGLAMQALFVRVGTDRGRPIDAVAIGLVMNVLLVAPIAVVLYHPNYRLTLPSIAAFAAAGLIGSIVGRVFFFAGIARAGASRAEAVKASQSLLAALLAVVLLGESLALEHLSAIVLIVGGLALLATESTDDPLTGERITWRVLAIPFAAAFFFGLEPVFVKWGLAEGTPTLVGISIKGVVASLGFFAYLAARDRLPSIRRLGSDLKWFIAAGVANTVFVVGLYVGLGFAPVNVVVPIVQSSPLLVVAVSALVLRTHERITVRLVVAAAMVVAGAVGVTILG